MGQTFVPRLTGSVVMRLAPRQNVDDSCDALFLLSLSARARLCAGWLIRDACLGVLIVCRATCQFQWNMILIILFAPQLNICTCLSIHTPSYTIQTRNCGEPNHNASNASVILFEALCFHSGTTTLDSARKGVKCGSALCIKERIA